MKAEKRYQWLWAVGFLVVLTAFLSLSYDFFYDLNDDVLMKDLLAGVYTGEPESRNIQMLYGISLPISLLYRLLPRAPWYGIFLCTCQLGSIGAVVGRALGSCRRRAAKGAVIVVALVVSIGVLLNHLVFVQYTITCTMLAAAAAFLFFTSDSSLTPGRFIRQNVPAVLLVVLAYLIRSEMLLLVLPLICVAGVCKWGSEERIGGKAVFLNRDHCLKYFGVIGAILLGILAGELTHRIAHSGEDWKRFTEYFDNRTELYDFQEIPQYEGNEAFYESIGLSLWERELLDNYNFGLSNDIDETRMGEIAVYAKENSQQDKGFGQRFTDSIREYCYRLFHVINRSSSSTESGFTLSDDYPYNLLVLVFYGLVGAAGVGKQLEHCKAWTSRSLLALLRGLWQPMLLFLIRTPLWLFILFRNRSPERITHSLYLMELCILAAMLLVLLKGYKGKRQQVLAVLSLLLLLLTVVPLLPGMIGGVRIEQARREQVNQLKEEMDEYFKQDKNQNNFYFIDVYSTVSFSEKMFVNVDNSLANYDIMGGWANKSPLYEKKLAAFGIASMVQALIADERVYFVSETGSDLTWLAGYYRDQGITIDVELIDCIGDGMNVYRILTEE